MIAMIFLDTELGPSRRSSPYGGDSRRWPAGEVHRHPRRGSRERSARSMFTRRRRSTRCLPSVVHTRVARPCVPRCRRQAPRAGRRGGTFACQARTSRACPTPVSPRVDRVGGSRRDARGRRSGVRSGPVATRSIAASPRRWNPSHARASRDPDAGTTLRSLAGSGEALLDQGRLVEAEAVLRTALTGRDVDAPDVRRLLAETLAVRGDLDAAGEALQSGKGPSALARSPSRPTSNAGAETAAAGRLATDALGSAPPRFVGDVRGEVGRNAGASRPQEPRRGRAARARGGIAASAARSSGIALRTAAEALRCQFVLRRQGLDRAAGTDCSPPPAGCRSCVKRSFVSRWPGWTARSAGSRAASARCRWSTQPNGSPRRSMRSSGCSTGPRADDESAALRTIADHLLDDPARVFRHDPIGAAATPGGRGRSSVADRCRDQ